MDFAKLNRRTVITGTLGMFALASSRAALAAAPRTTAAAGLPDPRLLKPLFLSEAMLARIVASVRPFRKAGPRLESETINDKKIIHCYGHGGCGWSLSWGYADQVARLVLASPPASVAVVGAGAIGLTTATALRRAGIPTTIYARELPLESRSAGATGTWSADSRIATVTGSTPDLARKIEDIARASYRHHQQYLGLADYPVEFTPRFFVPSPQDRSHNEASGDFLSISDRLEGMTPPMAEIPAGAHPFPTNAPVLGGLSMSFNLSEYAHRIMEDFLLMGGSMRRAEFHSPAEVAALPETVIVNCTGYGARDLWKDESLIPVRGQIARLATQSDRLYGVVHNGVMALSRRDGLIIQYAGSDENFGMGIADESPDREEFLMALNRIRPMFDWKTQSPA